MQLQQFVPRYASQPEEKRQAVLPQVILQVRRRLQVRFLDDVGRIDAAPQAAVEAQGHHAFQPVTMAGQEAVPGPRHSGDATSRLIRSSFGSSNLIIAPPSQIKTVYPGGTATRAQRYQKKTQRSRRKSPARFGGEILGRDGAEKRQRPCLSSLAPFSGLFHIWWRIAWRPSGDQPLKCVCWCGLVTSSGASSVVPLPSPRTTKARQVARLAK